MKIVEIFHSSLQKFASYPPQENSSPIEITHGLIHGLDVTEGLYKNSLEHFYIFEPFVKYFIKIFEKKILKDFSKKVILKKLRDCYEILVLTIDSRLCTCKDCQKILWEKFRFGRKWRDKCKYSSKGKKIFRFFASNQAAWSGVDVMDLGSLNFFLKPTSTGVLEDLDCVTYTINYAT